MVEREIEGVLSNNLAEYDAVIMGDNERKAEIVTHAAEWVWEHSCVIVTYTAQK